MRLFFERIVPQAYMYYTNRTSIFDPILIQALRDIVEEECLNTHLFSEF